MKTVRDPNTSRFLVCFLLLCSAAIAQAGTQAPSARQSRPADVRAWFVSDIHFDPFWDPDKVPQLVSAPVSRWANLLSSTASPNRQQRFEDLQKGCHTRGTDTPASLFDSSLGALRAHGSDAAFVTLSGDLIAHEFSCKFDKLFPQANPGAYRVFVEKTIEYVLAQVHATLPEVPIYTAFGNNDSDCGDYRLDPHGEFLGAIAHIAAELLPATEREATEHTFAAGGFYSARLPEPLQRTRLVVLDDIFSSRQYATCGGKNESTGADEQMKWLREELARARREHETVWVMGHIPPGIDPYSTLLNLRNVCGGADPQMFLSSNNLAATLAGFSDVVRLAIFAHTHMDEMRFLKPSPGSPAGGVAMKLVPSISPINGNNPSITLASIDPESATLKDYRVFTASNQSGVKANWVEEYDFAKAYRQVSYSAQSADKLTSELIADSGAATELTQTYLQDFGVPGRSAALRFVWPIYACGLANYTAADYRNCLCSKGAPGSSTR